jgi:hypothetical protein
VVVVTKDFFHGYFDAVFDEFEVEVAGVELVDAAGIHPDCRAEFAQ